MNSVLSGSGRVSSSALSAIVFLYAVSGSATADALQAAGGIKAWPYPYRLLGLRPGDPVDDLAALFAERSEAADTHTERRLRIQSPQGKAFDLRYEATREIGDVGMQGRLANAPQDQITAFLATEAFGKRPLALFRVVKDPTEKAPEPAALRAQMEELYGQPSIAEMQGQSMTLIYAWGTDGFIADLDGQPVQTLVEDLGGNRTSERQFRICAVGGPRDPGAGAFGGTPPDGGSGAPDGPRPELRRRLRARGPDAAGGGLSRGGGQRVDLERFRPRRVAAIRPVPRGGLPLAGRGVGCRPVTEVAGQSTRRSPAWTFCSAGR